MGALNAYKRKKIYQETKTICLKIGILQFFHKILKNALEKGTKKKLKYFIFKFNEKNWKVTKVVYERNFNCR